MNNVKILLINDKAITVRTAPAKCRAELARYCQAPTHRHIVDCYKHPSASKQAAELAIARRIANNTILLAGYTVLSFNTHQFTAGYMLEGIDPETGEQRTVLCTETALNWYHYDVTDIL